MDGRKGDKNFMVLSRTECLDAANHLIENAQSLLNDAILLSDNGSYGRATSLLIHSTEETMKAFILFLDGNGFNFRSKVKGINSLFINHGLRYGLGMVISILYIFSVDLKKAITEIHRDPNLAIDLMKNRSALKGKLLEYLKIKGEIISLEIDWFARAEFLRQDGLYVDYDNEIKTPLKIGKLEFESVLICVQGMRDFVIGLIDSFILADKFFLQEADKIKHQFKAEGWYEHLRTLIIIFRDQKNNPFDSLSFMVTDFLNELKNQP